MYKVKCICSQLFLNCSEIFSFKNFPQLQDKNSVSSEFCFVSSFLIEEDIFAFLPSCFDNDGFLFSCEELSLWKVSLKYSFSSLFAVEDLLRGKTIIKAKNDDNDHWAENSDIKLH